MDTEQDFKVKVRSYQTDKNQTIRKMWESIAQRPSDFDMEIIKALQDSIIPAVNAMNSTTGILNNDKNDSSNTTKKYGCYGDFIYKIIRDEYLLKFKNSEGKKICFLPNCSSSSTSDIKKQDAITPKKNSKESKKALILQQATMDKLHERIKRIMTSLNTGSGFTMPGEAILKSDILEVRAIGFIYMAWHLLEYQKEYLTGSSTFPFSVIVTMQRFINVINGYVGYNVANPSSTVGMEISSTLVADCKCLLDQLIKVYEFNGVKLYETASELILGCPLDVYLPKQQRNAFQHQHRVNQAVLNVENLRNGFMMFYRTMTNSGKTSSIVNLVACVERLRALYPSVFGELQVLATCDVNPVLTRWGQLLYHSGMPFGIASKRYFPGSEGNEHYRRIMTKATKEVAEDRDCVDVEMRFSNSDTCKHIRDRLAIICKPDIAVKILTKASNAGKRFILLHDEPTMYAESRDSGELRTNMMIFKNAPKWCIFSSATLPYDAEKTNVFLDNHRMQFPNATFIDNCSSEIYGCCNLRTYDGHVVVPHHNITTRAELVTAIEHIKNNPFLGKLYTPSSVKDLYERAVAEGCENAEFIKRVPRLNKIFSQIDNLFPDKVRLVALDILEAVKILDDSSIRDICSSADYEYESDDEDDSNTEDSSKEDKEDDSVKIQAPVNTYKPPTDINFTELGTSEAYRFPYLNLVATDKPYDFMNTSYNSLFEDVKKKIGSLDKLNSEYESRLKAWQTLYDSQEKNIKNADVLSKKLSELQDSRPLLVYPDECQINTKAHFRKYAKGAPVIKFRAGDTIANIELDDMHITDDTKLGLLSGVGCYGNPDGDASLDNDYLATVLELTSQKKMEALVADSSICYGTDYPVGGVLITPEFAAAHTLNTLYQLMSRAGRGRKSSNAEIYVHHDCAMKILETVRLGNQAVSLEIENMIRIFNTL